MMNICRKIKILRQDSSVINLLTILSSCFTELFFQLTDFKLKIEFLTLQGLKIHILYHLIPSNLLILHFFRILININPLYRS